MTRFIPSTLWRCLVAFGSATATLRSRSPEAAREPGTAGGQRRSLRSSRRPRPATRALSVAIPVILALPLAAVAAAPTAWATDAGDTPETATDLTFGTVFDGSLTPGNPKDFLKLDLPSSGAVTIEFQTTAREPVLSLLDSSMKVIRYGWPEFYTGAYRHSFPLTFFLVKGTHYLRVERRFPGIYYGREQADILAEEEPGKASISGTYSVKVTFESSEESILDTQDADKSVSSAWAVTPGKTYRGQISAGTLVNVDNLPLSDRYAPQDSPFYHEGDLRRLAGRQIDWYRVTVEERSKVEIQGGAKIVNEGWVDGTLDVCFLAQQQKEPLSCFLTGPANSDKEGKFEVLSKGWWYDGVLDKGTYYLAVGGGTVGLSYYFSVTTTAHPAGAKSFAKTYAPAISGTAKVGKTLTAKVRAWSPSTDFGYQWLRNGKAIDMATRKTYRLQAADAGKKVSVRVVSTKSGYRATARTSSSTKQVAKGTLTTKTPKIVGTAKVGKTLTARTSSWGPASARARLSYQWYRDGKRIKGATEATYRVTKADLGKKITVRTTGRATGYATATSKASKAVKPKR